MFRRVAHAVGIPVAALALSMGSLAIPSSATAISTGENAQAVVSAPCRTVVLPPFPLEKGWYFGPKSGPKESVSGYYSHRKDLKTLQRKLLNLGYAEVGAIDGYYGPKTEQAIKNFQKDKKLKVDGLAGVKTWNAAFTTRVCSLRPV